MSKVSFLGAGSWGTALAIMLAQNGHDVTLWSKVQAEVDMLQQHREHIHRLPGVKLPDSIVVTLLTEGASHFGVVGREISLSKETVCGVLKQGQPVICSVGRGDFTTEGHFIVLTGMKDGRIKVNDPNCIHRSCLWKYDHRLKIYGRIRDEGYLQKLFACSTMTSNKQTKEGE